ncbi:MAG: SDR family NAD(P)-dependent oxidoreductase [Gaiellaceae bacterium]
MSGGASLSGRVALVAGAGRGIGRAIAHVLAREGASLALVARSEDELNDVAAECGGSPLVLPCDVSGWESVRRTVEDVQKRLGCVDVLVNAAGIYGPIGPTAEVDAVEWSRAIDVNLVGAFNLCRAALPGMIAAGTGRIVLLAGGGATAPLPFFSAYAAAKAGVVRLAETIAEETKNAGITVNAIAPGLVDTRLQDEVLAAGDRAGPLLEKIRAARESGAGAVPPEVTAGLVVFLASGASGALTGKLIAAPYDAWVEWSGAEAERLNASAWYTLRRLDRHTLLPLLDGLA